MQNSLIVLKDCYWVCVVIVYLKYYKSWLVSAATTYIAMFYSNCKFGNMGYEVFVWGIQREIERKVRDLTNKDWVNFLINLHEWNIWKEVLKRNDKNCWLRTYAIGLDSNAEISKLVAKNQKTFLLRGIKPFHFNGHFYLNWSADTLEEHAKTTWFLTNEIYPGILRHPKYNRVRCLEKNAYFWPVYGVI